MKVSALIESLQSFDSNLEVVVRGHEGGYNNSIGTQEMTVVVDYYKGDPWMGNHEDAGYVEQFDNLEPQDKKVGVILIY